MSELAKRLLEEPVPPGGTPEWKAWQTRYAALSSENPDVVMPLLLAALEGGDLAVQHAALLGLRIVGCEAWGTGDDPEVKYEVRSPDRERHWIIVPRIQNLEDQLASTQSGA